MPEIPAKPLRIVIAGCGGMSGTWIRHTLERQDCRIVGLVDLVVENARAIAEKYHLDSVVIGSDLKQIIRETQASLVFNLAVPQAHREIALTAFGEGCAVFSEKPLAADLQQADEMIQAAAAADRAFSIMQNRRYLMPIRAFRQLLAGGTIGDIGYLGADFFLGPHFGGFRDLMASPLLLDMAIHTFDQARLITGADAVAVYCHEFNPPGSWYRGNASAIAIFEMSNRAVFCYRGSWCAEGCPTSWEADWRATGSRGTALWDGRNMPYAEILADPDPAADSAGVPGLMRRYQHVNAAADWTGREGHAGCLDEMFTALLNGQPSETRAADNRHSLAMVMAAIESARTGRRLMI